MEIPSELRSMTYGDLYQQFPILADCIESHEWDNMNVSEQRDWALGQGAGHKTERFKDALDSARTIETWTTRALTAEAERDQLRTQLATAQAELAALRWTRITSENSVQLGDEVFDPVSRCLCMVHKWSGVDNWDEDGYDYRRPMNLPAPAPEAENAPTR